jgi:hypothetical protein
VSATRLPEPAVLEPAGTGPAPPAGRGIGRGAARRIALFVLVLLIAGSAAWGAGRLLSAAVAPAEMSGHDMSGHDMSDMGDMPGMDMPGVGG